MLVFSPLQITARVFTRALVAISTTVRTAESGQHSTFDRLKQTISATAIQFFLPLSLRMGDGTRLAAACAYSVVGVGVSLWLLFGLVRDKRITFSELPGRLQNTVQHLRIGKMTRMASAHSTTPTNW